MPVLPMPGVNLHYEVSFGPRRPLVFVHGAGCSSREWSHQVEGLAGEFTVVTVDVRGHGQTRVDDVRTCTIRRMARDITSLLDELALPPAVLIGHSFGCRIALQAAHDSPARTAGVVLVDGSRVWSGSAASVEREQSTQLTAITDYFVKVLDDPCFLGAIPMDASNRIRAGTLSTPAAVLQLIVTETGAWDALELDRVLAALEVPLLAMQSTFLDSGTPRRRLREDERTPWLDLLAHSVRDLSVEILPGVGHFAMIEEPAAVNASLRNFVRQQAC